MMTGKEAKLAWADGKAVQWRQSFEKWNDLEPSNVLGLFDCNGMEFRLKPRTITINGIEVPAPFEPKEGDDFQIYYLHDLDERGYDWMHSMHYREFHLVWRTEAEIKQVVSALRSIFK